MEQKKLLGLTLVALLFGCAGMEFGNEPICPETETYPQLLSTPISDVPTWQPGDSAEYYEWQRINKYDPNTPSQYRSKEWIQLFGNVTHTVSRTEVYDKNGTPVQVYNVTMTGTGSGDGYTYVESSLATGLGKVTITNGRISGYRLFKLSDLGMVYEYQYMEGDLTVKLGLITAVGKIYYYKWDCETPSVEEYDFPIREGEVFASTTLYNEWGKVITDIISPLREHKVIPREYHYPKNLVLNPITYEQHAVAGTLWQFNVSSTNSHDGSQWVHWYNATAGFTTYEKGWGIVQSSGEITDFTNYTRILKQYMREAVAPNTVELTVDIVPDTVCETQCVYVNGSATYRQSGLPVVGKNLTVNIVDTPYVWYTQTNTTGAYSVLIGPMPHLVDNTPTTYDLGSFGVLVRLNETGNYSVSTITIIPYTGPQPVTVSLRTGWNLISFPHLQNREGIENVLQALGITDKCELVRWYDSNQHKWKLWSKDRNHLNALTEIDNKMGLWVYMNSDAQFILSAQPASTTIALSPGWNLIGYPSLNTTRTVSDVFGIYWGMKIIRVQNYTHTNYLNEMSGTGIMRPGEGYWVYATVSVSITIQN